MMRPQGLSEPWVSAYTALLPSSRAAILGWTGRGKLTDLQSTTESLLKENRVSARTSAAGHLLVVTGVEPLRGAAVPPISAWGELDCSRLRGGPPEGTGIGVRKAGKIVPQAWFKVQGRGRGDGGRNTLRRGGGCDRRVLDEVRGTRTSLESPRVRFRASFDGAGGAVGVEVSDGPGGVPQEGIWWCVSSPEESIVLFWPGARSSKGSE